LFSIFLVPDRVAKTINVDRRLDWSGAKKQVGEQV